MKASILLLVVLCSVGVYPTVSVSRWFSARFYDLRFTLRRYGHCSGDLYPLRDYSLNETEYLIYQIKSFLDQGNYENDQLANVTALMDNICRQDIEQSYPISVHIDVNKFSNNHTQGKENRCQAIDDSLDSMFYVFKRAALNRSEPLDFSVVQFYPNSSDHSQSYNLTDLINTSWIKSETILEHVCNITDSVKHYVQARMSANSNATSSPSRVNNANADKRAEVQATRVGVFTVMFDLIDRILDPILGLQKRLMWEGNNRIETIQNRLSSGLGTIRDGFGKRINSTRGRLSSMFGSSSSNSTSKLTLNSTMSVSALNSTSSMNVTQSPASSFSFNSSSMPRSAVPSSMPISTTMAPTNSKPLISSPAVSNNINSL